ncbi:MAG: ABC transporter permease, partial [Candidatus Aminicenantes bacterium]|nr:ABC transporter permease [Candidatus Aminicenantes bacterium]
MAGALRKPQLRAAALVLPLSAFILATFVAPLVTMLTRSVYDPMVADTLPETLALLRGWDGRSTPSEPAFEAASREILKAREDRSLGRVATRVNRVEAGLRSVIMKSARRLRGAKEADSWRDTMISIAPEWGEAKTWRAIRRAGERITTRHYLHALDLKRDADGSVVLQPEQRRVYLPLLRRTLAVSLGITVLCLLLGYPLAYLIAHAPPRRANLLLLLVLVPFW